VLQRQARPSTWTTARVASMTRCRVANTSPGSGKPGRSSPGCGEGIPANQPVIPLSPVIDGSALPTPCRSPVAHYSSQASIRPPRSGRHGRPRQQRRRSDRPHQRCRRPSPALRRLHPAAGKATAGPSWAGGLGSQCLQIRAYGSRAARPAGSSPPSIPHGQSWAAARAGAAAANHAATDGSPCRSWCG
jgi:hypothetical protein